MQNETIYIIQQRRPAPLSPVPAWLAVPFGTVVLFGFIAFMLGGVGALCLFVGV